MACTTTRLVMVGTVCAGLVFGGLLSVLGHFLLSLPHFVEILGDALILGQLENFAFYHSCDLNSFQHPTPWFLHSNRKVL
jgi:hypothetical protein